MLDGEDIANCPSCTLRIRVIFDSDSLPALVTNDPPPTSNEENTDSVEKDEHE